MRVKIVSDGTVDGTRVVDAETGELMRGVMGIQWIATPGSEAGVYAVLTLRNVEVDLETEAEVAPPPAPPVPHVGPGPTVAERLWSRPE
jgi:hypothetical protein